MKTAVEQLEDVLNKRLNHLLDNRVHIKEFVRTAKSSEIRKILETIHKFKEMEKENIIKAHTNGWNKGLQNNFIASQDYYNETFKSE